LILALGATRCSRLPSGFDGFVVGALLTAVRTVLAKDM
jgi:hypothetical protein